MFAVDAASLSSAGANLTIGFPALIARVLLGLAIASLLSCVLVTLLTSVSPAAYTTKKAMTIRLANLAGVYLWMLRHPGQAVL